MQLQIPRSALPAGCSTTTRAVYELIARVFDGQPEGLTRDDVLDNVTLYWLTNTAVSSARLYWESKLAFFAPKNVTIPTAVSALSRRALSGAAELGGAGLSQAHSLQHAPQRRPLRGVGAAGAALRPNFGLPSVRSGSPTNCALHRESRMKLLKTSTTTATFSQPGGDDDRRRAPRRVRNAAGSQRAPRELAALGNANEWLNSPRLTREQPRRESRARRFLDLHLHQLATPASVCSRVGGRSTAKGLSSSACTHRSSRSNTTSTTCAVPCSKCASSIRS